MADASSPRSGLRLTERDRTILGFAAEHRFVLAAHIGRLLGISTPAAASRLRALRAGAYLRAERRLRHAPTAFAVTRAALDAAGSELGVPRRVDLATYGHEVGVTWLNLAARRGAFGAVTEIVSERRMRSEDRRSGGDRAARHGVRVGWDGAGQLHYPDLTLVTATGHRIAVELELTTKDPRRRERILTAYAADRRIDAVVYLVSSAAAQRALERSARAVGAADRIHVQRFAWEGGRAPGEPARAVVRRPPRRARRQPGEHGAPGVAEAAR